MRGRKAELIDLKKLRGSYRRDRDKKSPEPSTKKPWPPSWLNKRAKHIFNHMVRRLDVIGLATATHTEMLALLCSRMEEVERFDKFLNEHGATYESKSTVGSIIFKERPEVQMKKEAARHVHSLLVEFGLSPAAVQKVGKVRTKKQSNEFSEF